MNTKTKLLILTVLLTIPVPIMAAGKFIAVGNKDETHRPAPRAKGEVVVTFDTMPTKVSFNMPDHVLLLTENGIPYTNGATETYLPNEGYAEGASYEPWNDEKNVYSRFWIESQNAARIIVRHRCALAKNKGGKFVIVHSDKKKVAPYGPGNWVDEWFIFNPDGTHTRHVKVWNAASRQSGCHPDGHKIIYKYELEGMYLWWGGVKGKASDHLEDGPITLIKMDGSHKTPSFKPYPLRMGDDRNMGNAYGTFRNANIHVINTKSKYRPWRMGRPSERLSITPYMPVHKLVQLVPCFPANSLQKGMYYCAGLGQMSWGDFWHQTDSTMHEIWLNGFTENKEPAKELAALGRFWQNAPKMKLTKKGGRVYRYSVGDLAYLLAASSKTEEKKIHAKIYASKNSPLINPAFLIKNWDKKKFYMEVNGKPVEQGKGFRIGFYKNLELQYPQQQQKWENVAVAWLELKTTKPIKIYFGSVPSSSKATAVEATEDGADDAEKTKVKTVNKTKPKPKKTGGLSKADKEDIKDLFDLAEMYINAGNNLKAQRVLSKIRKNYRGTAAAKKAMEMYGNTE